MKDLRDTRSEGPSHSPRTSAQAEAATERRMKFADEEVPLRAARNDAHGRYDLSWDGVSGGCGTDEGY